MNNTFKTVASSYISISELMLPSHTNFSGKIHGGYILSLLDQIAFACASKFSGNYCVTASVDTVNFLKPIEVGELVTMKASVNYVGKSSMIIGIRVEAENILPVPGLIISNLKEVRRFCNCLKQIALKKERDLHEEIFDYSSIETIESLKKYNVSIELN
jgi:uncharacterized protein (TIGR00369 family)